MRILFTNNTLANRAGTEMYVHDVALELKRLGHEPVAYSPKLGEVAGLIRASGVLVIGSLAELPFRPDVIHGHHHIETMTALASLPGVPAISFCHGSAPWEEMPPVFPRIVRYIAVDRICHERVIRETGAPEDKVQLLLNFVDTDAFQPRPALPARPARALILSNYATEENYVATVRAACGQCGIGLDVRGFSFGNPTSEPQGLLPHYDIVFAKARAAIEAMAVGCAVVLCDGAGLGPLVSSANVAALRPDNFGLRTLTEQATVENVASRIQAYDPSEAAKVRDFIRREAGMKNAVLQLVQIYGEVIAEYAGRRDDPVAELRAAGAYLQALDTVIKHAPLVLPPPIVPDAIARSKTDQSWLRRLFGH